MTSPGDVALLALSDSFTLLVISFLTLKDYASLCSTNKRLQRHLEHDEYVLTQLLARDILAGYWFRPHPKVLRRFPSLHFCLKLYDIARSHNVSFRQPVTAKDVVKLANLLPSNPRLEFLRFYQGNFEDKALVRLAEAIRSQDKVSELQLWHNHQSVSSWGALLSVPSLRVLSLHHCDLNDEAAAVIANSLPSSGIIKLYIGNNAIGNAGVKSLAACLTQTRLSQLGLSSNRISDDGAMDLANALCKSLCPLAALYLTFNKISNTGARALLDALDVNKTLNMILLSGNAVDTEILYVIAEAVKIPRRRSRHA